MEYKIPYHKPLIKVTPELMKTIQKVLESGEIVNGYYVRKLEDYFFSNYLVYAVACANATSGMSMAIGSIKAWKGIDKLKVSIPAFTRPNTWYAATQNNCSIWPSDINIETWLMQTCHPSSDLIISTDTFGNKSNFIDIKPEIPTLYDASYSIGLKGLGWRGTIEVVSFAHTTLVTGMQGGMILTTEPSLYMQLRSLRDSYSKMTEINAIICLDSIERIREIKNTRDDIINKYFHYLKKPYEVQRTNTDFNVSVLGLLFDNPRLRDKIKDDLLKNGIETKIYYKPMCAGLPNSDNVFSRILCFPIYPEMSEQVEFICDIVNKA